MQAQSLDKAAKRRQQLAKLRADCVAWGASRRQVDALGDDLLALFEYRAQLVGRAMRAPGSAHG